MNQTEEALSRCQDVNKSMQAQIDLMRDALTEIVVSQPVNPLNLVSIAQKALTQLRELRVP